MLGEDLLEDTEELGVLCERVCCWRELGRDANGEIGVHGL